MKKGIYKRILVVATGALLSPLSFQQNETIPCIAHAVAIEMNVRMKGVNQDASNVFLGICCWRVNLCHWAIVI